MGRWSNGPTWIEFAASLLGVSLTDYGGGGATTGSVPARKPQSSAWWGVSHASKGFCICCASIIWQLALPKSCLLAQNNLCKPRACMDALMSHAVRNSKAALQMPCCLWAHLYSVCPCCRGAPAPSWLCKPDRAHHSPGPNPAPATQHALPGYKQHPQRKAAVLHLHW